MTEPQSAFRRAPRPLIGWNGVVLAVVCVLFLFVIALIAIYALWRWANGLPVDLMGFAALISAALPAGGYVARLLDKYMDTRSFERVEEIRAGGAAPQPPFPSPPTSPDTLDPRPGENHQ